jgi:serine protease
VSFNIVTTRTRAAVLAALAVGAGALAPLAHSAEAAPYAQGQIIVGYASGPSAAAAADVANTKAARRPAASPPSEKVVRVPRGVGVWQEISRLRHRRGVAFAVPDYLAHMTGAQGSAAQTATPPAPWVPDDPGPAHRAGGWEDLQWNFMPTIGIDLPQAWANMMQVGRPGGQGVVVAILDTGVAYRNWHDFRRSPDFTGTHFVHPYDFVSHNRYPLDREGHGTFVAGTIAEATNNGYGLTGIAYRASIMPVRVLNRDGWGDAVTIARGIRYAVHHGAQVINLSLEFDPSVTAGEIPEILSAIRYAHRHRVIVVAASGNEASQQVAYPARASAVISVGATTKDRCLAEYSNAGRKLDLVAPGGGDDARLLSDSDCNPDRILPDIYQMTFNDSSNPRRFGFPGDWFGTSMAAPQVAGVAALVIASGVLGAHPSPDQVLTRLEQTAQPLGGTRPNPDYGYGLLDAGAATAPIAQSARR